MIFNMKMGNMQQICRHQFQSLSVEEARAAIRDLFHFCKLNKSVRDRFEPLKSQLSEWIQRIPPSNSKELLKQIINF